MKQEGFSINSTGYNRLLDYLLTLPDCFKVKLDLVGSNRQTAYVIFIGKPIIEEKEIFHILENMEPSNINFDSTLIYFKKYFGKLEIRG